LSSSPTTSLHQHRKQHDLLPRLSLSFRVARQRQSAFPVVGRNFSDVSVTENTVTGGDDSTASSQPATLSSPKLQSLYDTIVDLPEKDVNILGALVIQVLGRKIFPGEFGGGGGAVAAGGEDASGGDAPLEVAVKTVFDLKLVGFDAKAKIKVIKEVRAIAGLGLKEAKELVESAPKIIQKDLKQEKADEIKAQLEAVGATVELV
jgi:large subunit ribosomal protein L7/L12